MPVAALTALKLLLLLLLYLFVARAVRAVFLDLHGPRRKATAAPRPAVATPTNARKPRRPARELVVHPPEGKPLVVALSQQQVSLGRSERTTIQLQDVYVSDEHALIAPDGEGWLVRDLGSTNGTYLNGARVTRPTPLAAGDQLRLGKTRVEVRR